ncbi:MAG: PD-(D/E)XK nuclease family transposase, partial [Ruminococcus sp.]
MNADNVRQKGSLKDAGDGKESRELEQRYKKYQSILRELTLMSDIFMRNVLKKKECVEYMLRIITGRKDLQVLDHVVQKDYKNLQGRSAVLDCVACDTERRRYDMEIQQTKEGASPRRARYYSSLMDMNMLEAGQDFEELPESSLIFIMLGDALGYGLPA